MSLHSITMLEVARQHQAAIAEQLGWARRRSSDPRPVRVGRRRSALRIAVLLAAAAAILAAFAAVAPSIPARADQPGHGGQVTTQHGTGSGSATGGHVTLPRRRF